MIYSLSYLGLGGIKVRQLGNNKLLSENFRMAEPELISVELVAL